jgi:hypothetical protein
MGPLLTEETKKGVAWTRHVAIVSETTNVRAQNILVRKPKEKRLLGKPRCKGG